MFAIRQIRRRPPFRAEVYVDGDQVLLRIRHNIFFLIVAGLFAAAALVVALDLIGATRVVPHGPLVLVFCFFATSFFVRIGFDRQDWRLDLSCKLVVYEGYHWLFGGRGLPGVINRIEIVPVTLRRGKLRWWEMHAVVIRGGHNRYWIVAVEEHAPPLMEWVHEWAPADWVSRSNERMSLSACV